MIAMIAATSAATVQSLANGWCELNDALVCPWLTALNMPIEVVTAVTDIVIISSSHKGTTCRAKTAAQEKLPDSESGSSCAPPERSKIRIAVRLVVDNFVASTNASSIHVNDNTSEIFPKETIAKRRFGCGHLHNLDLGIVHCHEITFRVMNHLLGVQRVLRIRNHLVFLELQKQGGIISYKVVSIRCTDN
jgi:hypothetical protein